MLGWVHHFQLTVGLFIVSRTRDSLKKPIVHNSVGRGGYIDNILTTGGGDLFGLWRNGSNNEVLSKDI